jgi:hypothetical protein
MKYLMLFDHLSRKKKSHKNSREVSGVTKIVETKEFALARGAISSCENFRGVIIKSSL